MQQRGAGGDPASNAERPVEGRKEFARAGAVRNAAGVDAVAEGVSQDPGDEQARTGAGRPGEEDERTHRRRAVQRGKIRTCDCRRRPVDNLINDTTIGNYHS